MRTRSRSFGPGAAGEAILEQWKGTPAGSQHRLSSASHRSIIRAFTGTVPHHTGGGVNVLNLVEGAEAVLLTLRPDPAYAVVTPGVAALSIAGTFIGSSFPKREISFNTDVTLWDAVRLSALFDHKGDYYLVNQTKALRCVSYFVCDEAYNGSLEDQAAAVAFFEHGTYAGYIERADFVKLRELALTFMIPRSWTSMIRANDLRLTLAGRNLFTWTDYTGLDPEINSYGAATNFEARDISTLPANRALTLRIDANF